MKIRSLVGLLFLVSAGLALSACAGLGSDRPLILSGYQSYTFDGKPRFSGAQHPGVDFGELFGAPVLASADGKVIAVSIADLQTECGIRIIILHLRFFRYTVYCHLSKVLVGTGQVVKRGEIVGLVGSSGTAAGGIPHVHFELTIVPWSHRDGNLAETENPLAVSEGCFDPEKSYPTDKFVLTYPVKCKD